MKKTTTVTTAVNQLKAWFAANLDDLAKAGVASIEAEYSGSGDSGQYDGAFVCMADEKTERYRLPSEIDDLLSQVVDEVTSGTGYEDNDGGGGKILLTVETGTITHQSYYYELETHDNEDQTL